MNSEIKSKACFIGFIKQAISQFDKRPNVCFLLTNIPNPRMNKRIEVLKKEANVYVVCTRRSHQNIWEPAQDVEHFIYDMDIPDSSHFFKRFLFFHVFKKRILSKLNDLKPNILYSEGLDTLAIACNYKKKHFVNIFFEVADVREIFLVTPRSFIKKVQKKVILNIEKNLFALVDYLVVTSPKFYSIYYHTLFPAEKTCFIPNIPDPIHFAHYTKKKSGIFTIGFIGGIRYLRQMKMLVDASQKLPCRVLFFGAGGSDSELHEIKAYCKDKSNIVFNGRFDYNSEIASIYSQVDCVYSVYDADNPNVRIALPNKLYESIYCEIPIIVSKNTYLGELVLSWNVGIAVNHTDLDDLVNELSNLMTDTTLYNSIVNSCQIKKNELFSNSLFY